MTTMDGYVRVSRRQGREGESYISPRVQRDAIERWAEYKGITIAAWHLDEDWSGGTHARPGLEAAIDRALRGETGGIVSWKIDRFSRYTEHGLRDLARLQDADARLAFVVEDVDTGGPMGKFVYTIMLAMAELFLENIKAGWVAAKKAAIDRGVHIGPTPLGYLRTEDSTLTPDDAGRGPVVARAFRVAAELGVPAAIEFLTREVPERTWTKYTTARFLANRTYLGETSYGNGLRHVAAHPALVDRATFETVQRNVAESAGVPRRPHATFPLSQLASCGSCGAYLVGGRGGADGRRVYRCSARCDRPVVVSADILETHVVALVREAFRHPGFRVGVTDGTLEAAERALEAAEAELDAFAADTTARGMLGHRYHQALAQRVAAMDDAREALRDALAANAGSRVVPVGEVWDSLEPGELATVLRAGLDSVIVKRGRLPIGERVRVRPKGFDSPVVPGAEDVE